MATAADSIISLGTGPGAAGLAAGGLDAVIMVLAVALAGLGPGPGLMQVQVAADVPPTHRVALVDLYFATNGAGWRNNTNWLSEDPCAGSWFGLGCDGTTTVTYVHRL